MKLIFKTKEQQGYFMTSSEGMSENFTPQCTMYN